MNDVMVLDNPAAVASALDPIRSKMLAVLAEPHSATTLAAVVGLTRQKVNYHLRALETHGLVEPVQERTWGGITERIMQAVATNLVVSPAALQHDVVEPGVDEMSASYLIAVASRAVVELGGIVRDVTPKQRISTLTIDTVVGFATAADRAAFANDLQVAIHKLVAQYHHDDGRPHRVVIASYPRPAINHKRRVSK